MTERMMTSSMTLRDLERSSSWPQVKLLQVISRHVTLKCQCC